VPRQSFTAFGETKSIVDWSKDERCIVKESTLRTRVIKHNWSGEKALTAPIVASMGRRRKTRYIITAFGESKSAGGWAKDNRCVIGEEALKARIILFKWAPEKAITTPHQRGAQNYKP
jgi:hypothetical protein